MLVYANHLVFQGADAEDAVLKAIGGWLKEQLGFGLRPDLLRKDGSFEGHRDEARSWLRIVATTEEEPQLYSWVLKNQDSQVYGRQWVTELGVKVANGTIALTCVVKVDDQSTLVADPIVASRPRVVVYAVSNVQKSATASFSSTTPGVGLKTVGQDADTYRGLQFEIERRDRDYPIVLVSPTVDGEYLIAPQELQDDLVGLAQVVQIAPAFNSYEMAEILGERWSAWRGAVNLLNIPSRAGAVRGHLFLADEIETWGSALSVRKSKVLAWVTGNTNISRLKEHIRPEGVVQLALRRRLEDARTRSEHMDALQLRAELEKATQLAEKQATWISALEEGNVEVETELSEYRTKLNDATETIAKRNFDIESLKDQLQSAGGGRTSIPDVDALLRLASRVDSPSPIECLEVIASVYSDRCVVLDTAYESARDMRRFVYGRKLLDMLRRLVTEYRSKLIEGGDSKARQVFGKNEFAAMESETVMNNKAMRRARTFYYRGEPVEMFRHLKISVDDDTTKTIRVHFHWDADRERIAIGYCGAHLPVASH